MYKVLATAAVAATMMAAPAAAVTMNGTLATSILSVASDTPSIGTGSTLTLGTSITGGETGNFTGLGNTFLTTISPFVATNGSAFSFTSSFGDFVGTLSNVAQAGPVSNRSLVAYALGTFTPAGPFSTYDPGAASLTFSFTQNNADGAIQGGFTLSTPPAGVPEASTWMMLIAGFGLSGAAMRRRRVTTVAA